MDSESKRVSERKRELACVGEREREKVCMSGLWVCGSERERERERQRLAFIRHTPSKTIQI